MLKIKSFVPFSDHDVFGSNLNYSGYNRDSWEPRIHSVHCQQVCLAKSAATKCGREAIERDIGARYSELLRLPYFNIVRFHLVDPMHNLLLGTAKNMMKIWKESGLISNADFEDIQHNVDSINLPAGIGRIPRNIESGFADFTAEQWKTWTIVLSPYVLCNVLPPDHYAAWCLYSEACSILCRPIIHQSHVHRADDLLVQFCTKFENLYGKQCCTPNMHLHCHLGQSILDVYRPSLFFLVLFIRTI